MKLLLTIAFLVILQNFGFCQHQSYNGESINPYDTIRVFVIYAQLSGDPNDTYSNPEWPRDSLPVNPNFIFAPHESVANNTNLGLVTKYFLDASFNNFVVLGDYFPELVSIPFAAVDSGGTVDSVLLRVHNTPGSSIVCGNGFVLDTSSNDFDLWTEKPTAGDASIKTPDREIDFLMIIWRVNSTHNNNGGGGYVSSAGNNFNLRGFNGIDIFSEMNSRNNQDWGLVRHEFAHTLFGGNPWHNCGRTDADRVFMHEPGGYSTLSRFGHLAPAFNGYDRHRVNWLSPTKTSAIMAACPSTGTVIDADLSYGQSHPCSNGEYILRDFASTGDAMRIPLPYIDTAGGIHQQYLWLENRQNKSSFLDLQTNSDLGVYAYVQVGNDDLDNFTSVGSNYLWFHNSFGQYDFTFDDPSPAIENWDDTLFIDLEKHNVFTGTNLLCATEANKDNVPTIFSAEHYLPATVKLKTANGDSTINNIKLGSNVFVKQGTIFDAFKPGNKIGINELTSACPLLAWLTPEGGNPNLIPGGVSNRTIHLNGISVEILSIDPITKDARIKIRWDDFDITNDVRWCGPIESHEDILVHKNKNIFLDFGLTAQRPVNPVIFKGQEVFNDATTLTLNNGSYTEIDSNGCIVVRENSTLLATSGSQVNLLSHGIVNVDDGGVFEVENGATVDLAGNAKIVVASNGTLVIDTGANLTVNNHAKIVVKNGGTILFNGGTPNLANLGSRIVVEDGGTIEATDGNNLEITGDGFIDFYQAGNVKLGVQSTFLIAGSGPTDLKIRLNIGAQVAVGSLQPSNLNFPDALIEYNLASTINLNGNLRSNFSNIQFTDVAAPSANALFANDNLSLEIADCNFDGFFIPVTITNYAANRNVFVGNSDFTNFSDKGIEVDNVHALFLEGNKLIGTGAEIGYAISNCKGANSTLDVLENLETGILVESTDNVWLKESKIFDCYYGVSANESDLSAQYNTEIYDNDVGISVNGIWSDWAIVELGGENSCVWLYDNTLGLGGSDIKLVTDAMVFNNPGINRFDGNTTVFDICYSQDPSLTEIKARGHYWNATGGIGSNYYIGHLPISKNNCTNDITIDDDNYKNTYSNCPIPSGNQGGSGGSSKQSLNADASYISLYPNPASDIVYIENFTKVNIDEVQFFDITGKVVLSTTSSFEIDISNLNAGIYFVKVFGISQSLLLNQKLIVY